MGIVLRENPANLPDIVRRPYAVKCDRPNCFWIVAAASEDHARFELENHYCPWPSDMTARREDMAKGMTQFQKMFQLLDGAMDGLQAAIQHQDTGEQVRLKGYMSGLAEAVVITMVPIFNDSRSVAIEVKKRYDARQAGTKHETPGVDYTWKPTGERGAPIPEYVPDSKRDPSAPAPRRPTATRRAGAGVQSVETRAAAVDESTRDSIIKGFSAGAFTPSELAGAFNLKEDVVQYIIRQSAEL